MNIKIATGRLLLREFLYSDEDGLFELDSNPNVHTYLGRNPVQDKEQVRKTIDSLHQQYRDSGIGRWAVTDKHTGEFMGWSGLKLIKEPMNGHVNFYEIGYRLIEKHWGKGIATETAAALLEYAFETIQTDAVYAICDIGNEGSKNVLLKTGLTLIETFSHEGAEHNWFRITKNEWAEATKDSKQQALQDFKTMQTDDLLKQVSFIKEIDKLKYIQRKTKLFNSDRHENDAEHSWHLAMMAIILAGHSDRPIDILKVLKMVLIHDIVEIDAGDTFIYDTAKNHSNTAEELIAAERIFGLLPTGQAEEFIEIWKEFEEGMTDEAKFAKAMDRFEPLLQNTSNNGGTWTEFNVPYQKVYDKKKAIKNGSASIWNYAENLINESVEKGILKKTD
jgi:putative hydrolases of HD superfamily